MKNEYIKDGKLYCGEPITVGEVVIINPTDEILRQAGWEIYEKPEEPEEDLISADLDQ